MAYRTIPVWARVAHARVVSKAVSGFALGAALYAATTTGTAVAPQGEQPAITPTIISASLSFDGADLSLNGSVHDLFRNSVFTGPNRAEKQARQRPVEDAVSVAQSFEAVRLEIAALRERGDPVLDRRSGIQVAQDGDGGDGGEPRMSVASINPTALTSDGLRAIDDLADGIPRPSAVPEQLAYARANTPATDFTPKHAFNEKEQWCLATAIYFEARGEAYRGQVAVAQVVMNRVGHRNYPDTICGVVYQNAHRRNACQFSFACDGIPDRINEPRAWAQAQEITQAVLNEEIFLTEVSDSTHYHATYVRPHWARNMDRLTQIGLHIFYRFKPGWRFG